MVDYTVSTVFTANTAPLQAGTARAAASMRTFQASSVAAGRSAATFGTSAGRAAQGVGMLGSPLGKMAGPAGLLLSVGAGLSASAKAAMSWESAFADVTKTVSGTSAQLAGIEQGLRTLSTEIPVSAGALAEIAASAGQLGIETENVLDFTRVIADLGATTNLAGAQGATELARFANITGMAQENFSNLGSTVVELGNNFETTEAEISTMALRIAGAGAQIGLSEADILGFATALSSVGIEAEAGGSAISRVMIDMAQSVESGGGKLETFAEVAGMSAAEFRVAFQQDAAGAIVSFITGLDRISQSGGNVFGVLDQLELSEIRVRDALLRTSGASDSLVESLDTSSRAWEENTALTDEAAIRYETTEAKVQLAKNALSDLAIDIGEVLLPALGEMATGLSEVIDWLDEAGSGQRGEWAMRLAEGMAAVLPGLQLLTKRTEEQTSANDEARQSAWELSDAYEMATERERAHASASEALVGEQEDLAASAEEVAAAVEAAAEALDGFKDAVDAALGAQFDLQEASDAVTGAMIALTDQVRDAKDAENEHATALQGNRREALANRDAFQEVVEAVGAEIQAMADHGASSGEMQATIDTSKERLRELADQLGFTEGDVDQYVDAIDAIPVSKYTEIRNDAFAAMSDVERYIATINSIPKNYHSTVTITTRNRTVGVGGPAGGGFIEGNRAAGGPIWPGTFLVGEQGPELVQMAGRGFVHNNQATRSLLGGDPIAGARALGIPGMAAGGAIQADTIAEAILRGPRSAAANLGFPLAGRYRNYGGNRISEQQQLNRAEHLFNAAPLQEQRRTLEIILANAADYSDLWIEVNDRLDRVNDTLRQEREESLEALREKLRAQTAAREDYADLVRQEMQLERQLAAEREAIEQRHAQQRAARLQARRDEILGFRSPFQTAGGNDVMGGTRFTAGGMVQESFGEALLRNLRDQTVQIGAWKEGLQQLRGAGASESLIETLGLDTSPAQLSAVRGLLEDVSTLGALNQQIAARANEAQSVVAYDVAGGYGQVSRDLTGFTADMQSSMTAAVDKQTAALLKVHQDMATLIGEGVLRPGSRVTFDFEGTPVTAIVKKNLAARDRDAMQSTRMAGL